jgi:hypothetical protein
MRLSGQPEARGPFLRVALALLILLFFLAGASPAYAAAPRLIIMAGDALSSPVVLSDWEDNLELVTEICRSTDVAPGSLADRPTIRLGAFWDRSWGEYVREGRLASLRMSQADPFGRYYPEEDGRPAAVELTVAECDTPKHASERVQLLLSRSGVPTSVQEPASMIQEPASAPWLWVGLAVGIIATASLGGWVGRRAYLRRRS